MRAKRSHWTTRAEDYSQLAREAENPEIRQVLEHLVRICAELGRVEKHADAGAPALSWMDRFTREREHTAQRWRIREAEYLAMSSSAASDVGQRGWRTLAGRCGELATYFEALQQPA